MSNETCKKKHWKLMVISVILAAVAVIGSLIWIAYELEEIDVMAAKYHLQQHIYVGIITNMVLSIVVMFAVMLLICLLAVWFIPMLSRAEKGVKFFLGFLTAVLVVGLLTWMTRGFVTISAASKAELKSVITMLGNNSFLVNQAVSDNSFLRIGAIFEHYLSMLAWAGCAMFAVLMLYGIIDGFRRFICVLEKIEHNTKPNNQNGEKSDTNNDRIGEEATE